MNLAKTLLHREDSGRVIFFSLGGVRMMVMHKPFCHKKSTGRFKDCSCQTCTLSQKNPELSVIINWFALVLGHHLSSCLLLPVLVVPEVTCTKTRRRVFGFKGALFFTDSSYESYGFFLRQKDPTITMKQPIYPSLPKSSKYLLRRCLDPLKVFSGGVWRSNHLITHKV